jgi:lipoyl-dependent peroxiredoxin
MVRKASAVWRGGLKDGKGTISASSGVLQNVPYSFTRRFEEEPGTNPEELIAAAHASCFSMQLSANLGNASLTAESIETTASVTLEPKDGKPTVTRIHLECTAKIPGAAKEAFAKAANDAKANCPISRLLNTEITLDTKLVG